MRILLVGVVAVLALACAGCVSPEGVTASGGGLVVRLNREGALGTGAVIGKDLVATVDHVHGDGSERVFLSGGRDMRVLGVVPTTGHEPIVVLKADGDPFGRSDYFRVRAGATEADAVWVWTLDGRQRFDTSRIVPGHSGSLVLDADGLLIGFVWGRRCAVCANENKPGVVYADQTTLMVLVPADCPF